MCTCKTTSAGEIPAGMQSILEALLKTNKGFLKNGYITYYIYICCKALKKDTWFIHGFKDEPPSHMIFVGISVC
jgi:hypothetical protein